MTRRRIPALVLAVVVALTGCTSMSGTGDKGFVSGDGQLEVRDASDREAPIELTGEGLDGEPLDLADFRGKPVVINVWGAWCTYCRDEAPDVVGAAEELGDEASFVGINLRDSSPETAQSYERTFGVEFPSFYAPDGKAMLAFPGTLTPSTIPATVVLDAEGRVAASIIGRLPSQQTLVDVTRDVADETAQGSANG